MSLLSQYPRQRSLCGALRDRQLFGSKVYTRPFLADFQSEDQGGACILNNPGLVGSPAFACEYSKVYNNGKFLAVADEEGFISIMDTSAPLPRSMADDDDPKPRAQWLAHKNAVFDVAWAKNDSWMLAASGDQTISLWDTGLAEPLGTFRAHTGSVKSLCPQPGCHDVFASGGRDGVLMVWDARVPAVTEGQGEACHKPMVTVQDAHAPDENKRKSRRTPLQGRTKPSVTSVLFTDATTLASGGVDGILKLWDLRQAASPVARQSPKGELGRLCSVPLPSIGYKQHGITSLALHPNGVELLVSLTGGHHMMYQLHRPHIGPTKLFGGHTVASFYVKAAFSPDGSHILSGSTDRKVYIWQVDGADGTQPYTLSGHEGEVTAVAWCGTDMDQIATTADDATVRVWTVKRGDRAVNEVKDVWQPQEWQDPRVGLRSTAATSPAAHPPLAPAPAASASPDAVAGRLSQPITPQVPTARRTPATARVTRGPAAALADAGAAVADAGAAAAAAPSCSAAAYDENAQGNLQQQQQSTGRGTARPLTFTPAASAPSSPSQAQPVWRPASTARRPRSVAELQVVLDSQQKPKRTKQQSIATFLSPRSLPAASPPAGQGAPREGCGAGNTGGSDCPGSATGAAAAAARAQMSPRRMQMSPRLKRLRVSFELPQNFGSGSGSGVSGDAAEGARTGCGASEGPSTALAAIAAASLQAQGGGGAAWARGVPSAAAAASRLEPSPASALSMPPPCFPPLGASNKQDGAAALLAAAAVQGGGGGAVAGAKLGSLEQQVQAGLQRQGSVDENAAANGTVMRVAKLI